jgi:4-alpha-glucanotransferase
VDFGPVIEWKRGLLERAAARFEDGHGVARGLREEFEAWRRGHGAWAEDVALFLALKDAHGGAPWVEWDEPLRRREPGALAAARAHNAGAVFAHAFRQWAFFRQWGELRTYAASRGVSIVGDAPIFVAHDSADVWANPGLFQLGDDGRPTAVAGVPPDYFSETGQLWGNPLYRWDAMAADGYAWWIERMRATLALVDRVRLDHFIGFTRSWAVPAGAADAREGEFQPGPGAALFRALGAALGRLPILAEDLGVLTPEVEALRDEFAFPGMKVLQFAFGAGPANPFLPHQHVPNGVVYTGTHDNDTTMGWWTAATGEERHHAQVYLANPLHEPAWDFLRACSASVADTCIVPAQDLLQLGTEARMNFPGRPAGNWSWRLPRGGLDGAIAARLRDLAVLYGRARAD